MTSVTAASFANFYYLANYLHHQQHQHYVAAAAAFDHHHQQQQQQQVAGMCHHKAAKRRKLDLQQGGCLVLEETRLLAKRGPVTFKPYSDNRPLREPTLQIGGRRAEKSSLPQKRKLGQKTGPASAEGEEGFSRGESQKVTRGERVDKKTMEKKSELRATTVENLFPEILTNIFEYLDVQSKGRVARVSKN